VKQRTGVALQLLLLLLLLLLLVVAEQAQDALLARQHPIQCASNARCWCLSCKHGLKGLHSRPDLVSRHPGDIPALPLEGVQQCLEMTRL
jgi:hypothetical protein